MVQTEFNTYYRVFNLSFRTDEDIEDILNRPEKHTDFNKQEIDSMKIEEINKRYLVLKFVIEDVKYI